MKKMFLFMLILLLYSCSNDKEAPILQSIKLENGDQFITIGEKHELKLLLYPSNCEYPNCTWESSDKNVISVTGNGIIEAKSIGIAIIKATFNTLVSASCSIKVIPKQIEKISINEHNLNGRINDRFALQCEVFPTDATIKEIRWYTTNDQIAYVDPQEGTVYCINEGDVDIIASTQELPGYTKAIKDTCHLNIKGRQNPKFKFENWDGPDLMEGDYGARIYIWESTNQRDHIMNAPHTSIYNYSMNPENGLSAVIETLATNEFSKLMGIYIMPGILYIGESDLSEFMHDKSKYFKFGSSYFGISNTNKLVSIKGLYNYKCGKSPYIYPDGSTNSNKKDQCGIYAVYYGIDNENKTLNTDNLFTDKNVIAIAKFIGNDTNESQFQQFKALFEYTGNKSVYDKYAITVIFTSSSNGFNYEGAVGSKLIVDDIEIELE